MSNNYTTMQKNGEMYVLTPRQRATGYDDANFMETGLALAGTLLGGQSLNDWIENRKNIKHIPVKHFRNLKYSRRAKLNN